MRGGPPRKHWSIQTLGWVRGDPAASWVVGLPLEDAVAGIRRAMAGPCSTASPAGRPGERRRLHAMPEDAERWFEPGSPDHVGPR